MEQFKAKDLVEYIKTFDQPKTAQEKAEYLIQLDIMKTAIDGLMERPKHDLMEVKDTLFDPKEQMKVAYQPEVKESTMNAGAFYWYMEAEKRLDDFLQVVTVNKTALQNLIDGKALEEKFRVYNGKVRSAFLKVTNFSKDDQKKFI